jgi:hypothetical protein
MKSEEYLNLIGVTEEELAAEIWKDVPNWEGFYQVSSLGRVKNVERRVYSGYNGIRVNKERILNVCKDSIGRMWVGLYRNAKGTHKKTSNLVLEAFVSPCPMGLECCHNDGNSSNNRLENLRWDTHKNNEADKFKHGTIQRGEDRWNAVLTREEVLEIRILYATGKYLQREIGGLFNTSQKYVSDIVNNKRWKWL